MEEVLSDSAETMQLLDEANAGTPGALDRLLARYRDELRRTVELRMDALLRARVDPSDVVQEAQLDAFRGLPEFLRRRPMPFRIWLRRTARERLIMLWRQHVGAARRSVGREVPLPEGSAVAFAASFLAGDATPSQDLARQELARRVRQALAEMDEPDREILLMRNFEGLSYQEAAYILDIDPAAARKRHGRALLRLHRLLSDGGMRESQL